MNNRRLLLSLFLLCLILTAPACGKKGDPFLPQKEFSGTINDLRGEWNDKFIVLRGKISGLKGYENISDLIRGCRVYYGQYPIKSPPCETCPIRYLGYYEFGVEVITKNGLYCEIPGKTKGQIYFFRAHFIGAEGAIGPPSNRARVVVE